MIDELDERGRFIGRNPNVPGYSQPLEPEKYREVRRALLENLPVTAPGWTQTEMRQQLISKVSQDLFPKGTKLDWWSKAVQLDLEARGQIVRETSKPLRWHKV